MLWSTMTKIGSYNLLMKIQLMQKLDARTIGVSSRIPNTPLHITFLDYDNIVDERLKEELEFLQSEFSIGNFYVLETRGNGRHAVCLDALRFRDVKESVDFTSCDPMFKKAPSINEYRCWVLRYAKKGNRDAPKYLYTVESAHEGRNLHSKPQFFAFLHMSVDTKKGCCLTVKKGFRKEFMTKVSKEMFTNVFFSY